MSTLEAGYDSPPASLVRTGLIFSNERRASFAVSQSGGTGVDGFHRPGTCLVSAQWFLEGVRQRSASALYAARQPRGPCVGLVSSRRRGPIRLFDGIHPLLPSEIVSVAYRHIYDQTVVVASTPAL
eukprot:6202894-Pleurochrysis_carterae.AAC.2